MGKVTWTIIFSQNCLDISCFLVWCLWPGKRQQKQQRDWLRPGICCPHRLVATERRRGIFYVTSASKTTLDKTGLFFVGSFELMPAKCLVYPLLTSGTSGSVDGRVPRTYVAGLLNSCPSVCVPGRCRLTAPLSSPSCSGWSSCACVLSSTWKRILLIFRYLGCVCVWVCVCVCTCVCARMWRSIRGDGSVFFRGDIFFSFRQETVSVIACAGMCLQACTQIGWG